MTDLATRDQLFAPAARRYATVQLPTSGLTVRIQSLTERERTAFQAALITRTGDTNRERLLDAGRRLIVLCLVDGAGNRMLNDSDVQKLADWDSADTEFLYAECGRHTGLGGKSDEVERKNGSEPTA